MKTVATLTGKSNQQHAPLYIDRQASLNYGEADTTAMPRHREFGNACMAR
jgi:hypothetical protein